MINTETSRILADLTKPGGALDLGPDTARLLTRMLRLLAEGKPVARDRVDAAIADLGINRETADATLAAWTERDPDGTVIGLGLTYHPTAHQLTIDGARMWAWCAMDTLIFAALLGKQVTIESTAPGTRDVVRLHAGPDGITDADPAGAVITWPRRDSEHVDLSSTTAIWGSFCHHSFLFPSRAQAERWSAGRDDIDILPLDDGFPVARGLARALTRYDAEEWR
ncbi:organomercurial lyase [Actinokineospora sp.]|uniref:organomercurial lyase n=1 Tax=Actinokineospora sp. TaxID=1872133 RepID=UPI003D6AA5BA